MRAFAGWLRLLPRLTPWSSRDRRCRVISGGLDRIRSVGRVFEARRDIPLLALGAVVLRARSVSDGLFHTSLTLRARKERRSATVRGLGARCPPAIRAIRTSGAAFSQRRQRLYGALHLLLGADEFAGQRLNLVGQRQVAALSNLLELFRNGRPLC